MLWPKRDRNERNLRTIIVIADVHWRFGDWREPLPLTFQHWSGVSPYTSPCGFAETCVFGKQSVGILSLRPTSCEAGKAYCELTPSFFAEFLNEGSPVHLGLLDQSTCVGLQYGYRCTNLRSFSWHPAFLPPMPNTTIRIHSRIRNPVFRAVASPLRVAFPGFTKGTSLWKGRESNNARRILECVTPSNASVVQEY